MNENNQGGGPTQFPTGPQNSPQNPPVGGSQPFVAPPQPAPIKPLTPGAIPPPPAPDITVRTMRSDISSLQNSGGVSTTPKTFNPQDFSSAPVFKPNEVAPQAAPVSTAHVATKTNPLIVVLGGIIFLGVATAVFYLFIKPAFFASRDVTENNPAPVTEQPIATIPTPAEGTVVTPDGTPATTIAPQVIHKSFLSPVPTLSENILLSEISLSALTVAVQKATSEKQANGAVKELVMAGDKFISTNLFSILLPELNQKVLTSNLRGDFTYFAYYDKDGVWPVYVFQLRETGDLSAAKLEMAKIEVSKNLANLYLISPEVAKSTVFADGIKTGSDTTRYLSYSAPGASLNYSWLGKYFVISTSYNGFKEAVKLLGL